LNSLTYPGTQNQRKSAGEPSRNRARTLLLLALALSSCTHPLQTDRTTAPADGATLFHFTKPVTIKSGVRYAHQESPTTLRTAVLPGKITVANGDTQLTLTTTPVNTDSAHDGTPDFLRLDTPADRAAFRTWFTFIAEAQFFRHPLPREINDCAALIRYSYREALSVHNDAWIDTAHLPELPNSAAVAKYAYPFTPLGAGIFRIHPGPYSPADATNGNFAQFADAETLIRFNTHLVSKDMDQALPGDILMYRQLSYLDGGTTMPFHTMIYLGPSQFDRTPVPYVVYHTGPKGEVRRPALSELQKHPDPRWRPFPANANFLGFFRLNILGAQ
jgi:uncharacterized protein YfaT (DUF1175 family)